jgi:hypothetical protein
MRSNTTTPEPKEKTLTESEAAELLGIRSAELRRLRREILPEEKEGGPISSTSAKKIGVAIASGTVALSPDTDAKNEVPFALPQPGGRCTLTVEKLVVNPRILIALDAEKKAVRVRVRDSRNFLRGMTLADCREITPGSLYAYEGRLPRLRGRWI